MVNKSRKRLIKAQAKTNEYFGKKPSDRTVEELLNNGVINLDKPRGPTSHQVVAWVKKILDIDKVGKLIQFQKDNFGGAFGSYADPKWRKKLEEAKAYFRERGVDEVLLYEPRQRRFRFRVPLMVKELWDEEAIEVAKLFHEIVSGRSENFKIEQRIRDSFKEFVIVFDIDYGS